MSKLIDNIYHISSNANKKWIVWSALILSFLLTFGSFAHNSVKTQSNFLQGEEANSSNQSLLEILEPNMSSADLDNSELSKDSFNKDVVKISGESIYVETDPKSDIDQHKSASNISIEISSKNQSSGDSSSENSAPESNITVNGEEIAIPKNGRTRETIKDENGTTRLRTNIDSDGSSSISISTESN